MGCIYRIWNVINSKSYVGQTSYNISKRIAVHFRGDGSSILYKAIGKYGKNYFEWEVLEDNIPISKLDEREIYWIKEHDSFKNGYNCSSGGGGIRGYKLSDESKIKMSNSRKGRIFSHETREKISIANKGKKRTSLMNNKQSEIKKGKRLNLSDKQRRERSDSMKGRNNPFYGKKHSEETKRKISRSKMGKKRGDEVIKNAKVEG